MFSKRKKILQSDPEQVISANIKEVDLELLATVKGGARAGPGSGCAGMCSCGRCVCGCSSLCASGCGCGDGGS